MVERQDDDRHADLDPRGHLGDRGGQHLGGGHHAIARKQMLGDPDRVEAQLFVDSLLILPVELQVVLTLKFASAISNTSTRFVARWGFPWCY